MNDKQILKSIRVLARGECANYHRGTCLLTDERCHLVNPNCESIHDGAVDCDFFLECMLPADWDLNDLLLYALWYDEEEEEEELPSDMKRCAECQQSAERLQRLSEDCKALSERSAYKEIQSLKRL